MLALWALFLLSALVISWALDINSRIAVSGEGTRMLKAEAGACSGAEIALHPRVNPGSPNLRGQLDNATTFQARITGEGGRIDINWIVAGSDPQRLEILRRYLENKGIDLNERDTMIDSLLDWVGPGTGLHRLNAPPESDDYHPAHALLTRIDELKKIAGWADFTATPGWDSNFTVSMLFSGGGDARIDLAWASRDVLLALPGMTNEIVDRFLQIRQRPHGIDGTEDDTQFKSPGEVQAAFGLNQDQFKQLENLVTLNTAVFHVTSVGTAGKATRTVQMVFRRDRAMPQPQVLTWEEF